MDFEVGRSFFSSLILLLVQLSLYFGIGWNWAAFLSLATVFELVVLVSLLQSDKKISTSFGDGGGTSVFLVRVLGVVALLHWLLVAAYGLGKCTLTSSGSFTRSVRRVCAARLPMLVSCSRCRFCRNFVAYGKFRSGTCCSSQKSIRTFFDGRFMWVNRFDLWVLVMTVLASAVELWEFDCRVLGILAIFACGCEFGPAS